MEHHRLDPYPIPKEKTPLYVNEPWLVDKSILETSMGTREPEKQDDNIRVYIPLDISKASILRRLDMVVAHYSEANEKNEGDFRTDVNMLVSQIEIYDQIWFVRHMPEDKAHSVEAAALVEAFVRKLEAIPDGCAETFPFETIEELKREYLSD